MSGLGKVVGMTHDATWRVFANDVIDWCYGYSNIEIDDGSKNHLKEQLVLSESSGFKPSHGIKKFLDELVGALKRTVIITPKILMSDKEDVRYREVVKQFYEAHPEKFLDLWLELREPAGYDAESIKPGPLPVDLTFFTSYKYK